MINPSIQLFTILLLGMVSLFAVILVLYLGLRLVGAPIRYFWKAIHGLLGMGTRRHDF